MSQEAGHARNSVTERLILRIGEVSIAVRTIGSAQVKSLQIIRPRYGQWTEKEKVRQRKHRRVRPDAEREREHGHGGEAGVLQQLAEGVAKILHRSMSAIHWFHRITYHSY